MRGAGTGASTSFCFNSDSESDFLLDSKNTESNIESNDEGNNHDISATLLDKNDNVRDSWSLRLWPSTSWLSFTRTDPPSDDTKRKTPSSQTAYHS
jgi:hypothetical protein